MQGAYRKGRLRVRGKIIVGKEDDKSKSRCLRNNRVYERNNSKSNVPGCKVQGECVESNEVGKSGKRLIVHNNEIRIFLIDSSNLQKAISRQGRNIITFVFQSVTLAILWRS